MIHSNSSTWKKRRGRNTTRVPKGRVKREEDVKLGGTHRSGGEPRQRS